MLAAKLLYPTFFFNHAAAPEIYTLSLHDALPISLQARFHQAHERRYGYRMQEEPVELVNVRVTATVAVEKPALTEAPTERDGHAGRRWASFGGAWVELDVFDRGRMGAGAEVVGPAIVEFAEATCVVEGGWGGRVDQ